MLGLTAVVLRERLVHIEDQEPEHLLFFREPSPAS